MQSSVTETHADAYLFVAEKVANFAASQNFKGLPSCAGLSESACGAKFADEFAPKVFRRPLTTIERAAVVKVFDSKYSGGDIKVAQSLGIQTLLTAPGFYIARN